MMKYLTIIAVIIFMTSCGNQSPKQKTEEVVVHEAQDDAVTLVNGKKWKVNFATNKGIRNTKALMGSVNNDNKLSDFRKLGENLQKEFREIFTRCDMTGEAHNQLHNYLHPLASWFKELKKGDLNQCRSTTKALKGHLEKYDSYFR